MSLKGKVALVTGGGSGIGAATVKRFIEEGAKVCIADINPETLKKTAANLPAKSIKTCQGDVSELTSVEEMVDTTLKFGGKIDILVNSAGIDPSDRGAGVDLELWNKIIKVNLTGPQLTMKTVVPHMIKSGGGSIINISSLSGIRFMAGRSAYTASKGGLIALTQAAAVEYGPQKIRCNVICPGAIKTPLFTHNTNPMARMLGQDPEWVFSKFTSFSPLRRIGLPEEIAGICYFLASDDSSLMTGGVLIADGGTHLVDANGAAISTIYTHPDTKK
ncbi:MAG TPA: SDR family oxidoreductase [Dehalococcoidales bacterium]|nr:SDR family oxidoreductase [Dehalococcoidales bacterium]